MIVNNFVINTTGTDRGMRDMRHMRALGMRWRCTSWHVLVHVVCGQHALLPCVMQTHVCVSWHAM